MLPRPKATSATIINITTNIIITMKVVEMRN